LRERWIGSGVRKVRTARALVVGRAVGVVGHRRRDGASPDDGGRPSRARGRRASMTAARATARGADAERDATDSKRTIDGRAMDGVKLSYIDYSRSRRARASETRV
jgi:hypothetical protein